ncbi:hypothetical protein GCM10023084_18770 [Streptomyces lacrimifluminis]|uniref:Uncharacterized protein n=1 Tax=Streptomyces lacrimifluminis TaxID=1500077 RepID=A0A917NLV4_9ACTN|nr:hypothetical protein GCM10012282_03140 [Streptomyces lacrimifluminis]
MAALGWNAVRVVREDRVDLRLDPRCRRHGKLDNTPEVTGFAEPLEQVRVETVEGGRMTKDLTLVIGPEQPC